MAGRRNRGGEIVTASSLPESRSDDNVLCDTNDLMRDQSETQRLIPCFVADSDSDSADGLYLDASAYAEDPSSPRSHSFRLSQSFQASDPCAGLKQAFGHTFQCRVRCCEPNLFRY